MDSIALQLDLFVARINDSTDLRLEIERRLDAFLSMPFGTYFNGMNSDESEYVCCILINNSGRIQIAKILGGITGITIFRAKSYVGMFFGVNCEFEAHGYFVALESRTLHGATKMTVIDFAIDCHLRTVKHCEPDDYYFHTGIPALDPSKYELFGNMRFKFF